MADIELKNNKFFLDTDDVLGFGYQEYVASIRALALSKPAEYFNLRREVLKKVKIDAVSNLYKTLFNVLSSGTDIHSKPIGILGSGNFKPNYPSQRIE